MDRLLRVNLFWSISKRCSHWYFYNSKVWNIHLIFRDRNERVSLHEWFNDHFQRIIWQFPQKGLFYFFSLLSDLSMQVTLVHVWKTLQIKKKESKLSIISITYNSNFNCSHFHSNFSVFYILLKKWGANSNHSIFTVWI